MGEGGISPLFSFLHCDAERKLAPMSSFSVYLSITFNLLRGIQGSTLTYLHEEIFLIR